MSLQTWQEVIQGSKSDSTAHANSTTPTTILPAAARRTIPANYFYVGQQLRLIATGRISNIVTTPGTLTLALMLGPTSNIAAFSTGAMQLSTTAHTNVAWWLEALLTVREIGSSTTANLFGQARFTSQAASLTAVADSTTTPATLLGPNSAPAVGTGFDSTVANIADLFATFSVANSGNSIQTHQYSLQALN
jgi:hypothetical protein